MNFPRIFVGTMCAGEAEFDKSARVISAQKDVVVTHHIIKDLNEADAHITLWGAWNAVKHQNDLFVKVDADTILIDDTALSRIYEMFAKDKDVTGAQIYLQDYFTDNLIAGLNCFSPEVIFDKPKNKVLCDRVDRNHRKVLKGDDLKHLAPIGYHGKYPNPRQAFHFGWHRQLKKQKDVIQKLARAWLTHQDQGRLMALAGAMTARPWHKLSFLDKRKTADRVFQNLQKQKDLQSKVSAFAQRITAE